MVKVVLGIAFASRRFGFVLTDSAMNLIDYGVKKISAGNKKRFERQIEKIIQLYRPRIVCVQDIDDLECQLGDLQRGMITSLIGSLRRQGVEVRALRKTQVSSSLELEEISPKREVFTALRERYSWLQSISYYPKQARYHEHWNAPVYIAAGLVHAGLAD